MKTMNLRSLMALVVAVVSLTVFTSCDKEAFIDEAALPATAQTFIKNYFPGAQIAGVMKEGSGHWAEYDVTMTDGTQLSFNHKGEWRDVDCVNKAVPADLVPQAIQDKVVQLYPQAVIVEISLDHNGYDVELDNGIDLEFNRKYVLKEMD